MGQFSDFVTLLDANMRPSAMGLPLPRYARRIDQATHLLYTPWFRALL
jgi:hypothetical protein